jgi:carbonic anhydrase
MIDNILKFNTEFVDTKQYVPYACEKFPAKKLVIVSCMDARLVELLPAALGIKNGDAKVIKNAGAMITQPDGSVMRSVLVAICALGAREVMVVGHTDCGMKGLTPSAAVQKLSEMGVTADAAELDWLHGFGDDDESVRSGVNMIKTHPLLPADIPVRGFVIDVKTGALREVV